MRRVVPCCNSHCSTRLSESSQLNPILTRVDGVSTMSLRLPYTDECGKGQASSLSLCLASGAQSPLDSSKSGTFSLTLFPCFSALSLSPATAPIRHANISLSLFIPSPALYHAARCLPWRGWRSHHDALCLSARRRRQLQLQHEEQAPRLRRAKPQDRHRTTRQSAAPS